MAVSLREDRLLVIQGQGATTVTRTFTVDEAGSIVKMTVAGMGAPGDGDYLVTWNGHGDAVELARIDPATGHRSERPVVTRWPKR